MFDSLLPFLQSLQGFPAYALIFGILVGSGFGLPMNEDILLAAAAALTLSGVMEPGPLIAVAWCGLLIADGLIFHWGRVFGARLVEHRWLARAMPPARLARMQAFTQSAGPGAIFAARFMPGVRSAVYFAAGSLRLPYRQQFLFDGMAAAIELPLLVYGVRHVGANWDEHLVSRLVPAAVILAAITVAIVATLRIRRRKR